MLNTLHYAEVRSANARLFEAAGYGAFVITHSNPGVREVFEPGEEVVAVESLTELRDAIAYYLGAEDERSRIAEAGQRRAHSEHTYGHRLQTIMDDVRGT